MQAYLNIRAEIELFYEFIMNHPQHTLDTLYLLMPIKFFIRAKNT